MAELVGRYQRPLFQLLLSIVRDVSQAEDLFQESFLRLHRYRSSFKPSESFRPYLYRIALNVVRDARARRKPSQALDGPAFDGGRNAVPLAERLVDGSESASERLERNEDQEQLRRAVADLSDGEREVVMLRLYEDMTFEQIAEIASAPASTVKSRFCSALRKLRTALQSELERDGQTIQGGAS